MEVTITEFEYVPGDKWSNATLNFTAKTPLGTVRWEETIPGPGSGEDHAERRMTINEVEIDDDEPNKVDDAVFEFPNFEAPNREGRYADAFRADGQTEVADLLGAWLDGWKDEIAARLAVQ